MNGHIFQGEKAARLQNLPAPKGAASKDMMRVETNLHFKELPLDLSWAKKEKSLKSLIELGVKGYFPLFHPDWAREIDLEARKPLTKKEKLKAKEIMNRLLNHRGLERKQIILLSLEENERNIFIRAFLDMVEGKIMDRRPELQ